MLTLQDCAALCALEQEEIDAIGQFEDAPSIASAVLADYLVDAPDDAAVRAAMVGDIRTALDDGLVHQATEIVMALRRFLDQHPRARPDLTIHWARTGKIACGQRRLDAGRRGCLNSFLPCLVG